MSYLVSVVIATYQRPALLARCLDCLCEQVLAPENYEVIVVSDGPHPFTRNTVLKFHAQHPDMNLVFLENPQNGGPAAARNLGWRNASAPLIAFTDDDCMPHRNWLASMVRAHHLANRPACFTGKVIVPLTGTPTDYQKNTSRLEQADFVTANCSCARELLVAVDGFDEQYKTAWREDSDLHFKLLKMQVPVIKITDAIVIHPVRKAAWGASIKEQRKSMFNALLYKKFPEYYQQIPGGRPTARYYFMAICFISAFVCLLLNATTLAVAFFIGWLAGVISFTVLRLKGTSKSFSHVSEMLITSMIIPFLSIYWTLYGAFKYKVVFL
jgi:GT2 family glycosyltransferase